MSLTALLPMKANSERVKGKNFRGLGGKPLYMWILTTLLEVPEIDRVVINTDADLLLKDQALNKEPKILLRKRSEEICGDMVSMNRVIENDVLNVPGDLFLMTHTTNPLLSVNTVREAVSKFMGSLPDKDSLFSVNKIQTRFYREDLSPVNHDPDNLVRTQDLEPWFEENSCLYLFTRESFEKTNSRIGERPLLYVTPQLESIDIDEPDDWKLAEAVVEYNRKRGGV